MRLLFHLCVFATYVYSVWYNVVFVGGGFHSVLTYRGYGGKLKYLTFINLILQTIYFGYAIINDLFGSNQDPDSDPKQRSGLQKLRDAVAASVIFPIGTFVVLAFWALYAVDRELVFPKHLDAVIPTWLNHIMHTTVIFFLLIEKFLIYHHYPSRSRGLIRTVIFASVYQVWIFWVAYYANIWVYPVLQVLGLAGRAAFITACWAALILIYLLGEALTSAVWGSSAKSSKKTA